LSLETEPRAGKKDGQNRGGAIKHHARPRLLQFGALPLGGGGEISASMGEAVAWPVTQEKRNAHVALKGRMIREHRKKKVFGGAKKGNTGLTSGRFHPAYVKGWVEARDEKTGEILSWGGRLQGITHFKTKTMSIKRSGNCTAREGLLGGQKEGKLRLASGGERTRRGWLRV